MTDQIENKGANIALIEPEEREMIELGINVFDNPFRNISAQDCVEVMREILDNPDIPSKIIEIRIAQMEAVNPHGKHLCHQGGVLPHNRG